MLMIFFESERSEKYGVSLLELTLFFYNLGTSVIQFLNGY
jgi:hypothetical protein